MVREKKENRCKRCNLACDGDFCSKDCEVKYLRSKLTTANKRVARKRRAESRTVQCLGRVEWERCCQEWYLKETFDVKRRACDLRHKGFEVSVQTIGEMPLEDGNGGARLEKVTILTAHYRENEKGELLVPPEPATIIEGLVEQERVQ